MKQKYFLLFYSYIVSVYQHIAWPQYMKMTCVCVRAIHVTVEVHMENMAVVRCFYDTATILRMCERFEMVTMPWNCCAFALYSYSSFHKNIYIHLFSVIAHCVLMVLSNSLAIPRCVQPLFLFWHKFHLHLLSFTLRCGAVRWVAVDIIVCIYVCICVYVRIFSSPSIVLILCLLQFFPCTM